MYKFYPKEFDDDLPFVSTEDYGVYHYDNAGNSKQFTTKDGPDIWYLLEIKHKGMFRVSMYFFNKDGHTGANRVRDYTIEIYPAQGHWEGDPYKNWKKYSVAAERTVRTQPPLAKSRMHDFWGGVYKQFL